MAADQLIEPLVLVVDDYEDARVLCAEYLRCSGFRVVEAATGQEALDKAFELRPDLVLMDLSLPGIDGWQATRRLKDDQRTRHIPILALTGHNVRLQELVDRAGCDGYLTKPCMPEQLVGEVNRLLAHRRRPAS